MKQPLMPAAVLYASGILAGAWIPAHLPPWLLAGAGFGLAALAIAWGRARPWLLCLLAVLAGWTNLALRTTVVAPNDLRRILTDQPAIVSVRGVLLETPAPRPHQRREKEYWRTTAQVEVTALSTNHQPWQPASGRILVATPATLDRFFGGQTVEITGVAAPPKRAAAEGTFDYRAYLRGLGISFELEAGSDQDWVVLASPAVPPLADRFRAWARRALARGLPAEDESLRLEWALTLGWKAGLTEEVSEPFIQAATYHIFAVDGLRMAIVFGIFFGLFRALGLPRPAAGAVLIPLIWFYVALTGWPASAIRATVMLTVVIVGWVLNRPANLLNSLFVAALIILAWEPRQLFQAGFQLSFLVVLCIILLLPPMREWLDHRVAPDPLLPAELLPRWRRWLRTPARYAGDLLLVSFAAWVGSVPLTAYYFHLVTPVSTPANIVAVPLCSLALASDLAGLLTVGWFPAAAECFNNAGWFLMESIRVTSHWFARWPAAYHYVAAPGILGGALYYGLLLAAATGWLFRPKVRAWAAAAFSIAAAFWAWQTWQSASATRLTVLALSGGSAIYLDPPGGRHDLLIDCGSSDSVQLLTKPFLRAQGVNRLAGLVLTYGNSQHTGGAPAVDTLFSPRTVWASPVRFRSAPYRRALAELSRAPNRLHTVSRGDRVGPWEVLHPQADDRFSLAEDSALVLMGQLQGVRVLLLSSLGRHGQNALLERRENLKADILVTGVPGASEAVGEDLLDAVQPSVIVVADSEFPVSARANAALRERLARRPVPVLYTRSEGAATLEVRRGRWEVRTMSGARIAGPP